MTGSEPANSTVSTGGDNGKTREEEAREQLKQEESSNLLTESSSSSGSTQKLPLSDSFNNSLSSTDSLSCSNSPESSPSPDLHSSPGQEHTVSIGVEDTEDTPPVRTIATTRSTGARGAAPRMKRTVSNCNVRNTSTMCSKDSSYVYHCPSRRRTQKRSQPKKVPDPASSMDAIESQFHLMLLEDSVSDDTQSMVELGTQPFRARGLHGSSLRKGAESRSSQVATRHGTKVAGMDHLHNGPQVWPISWETSS